MAQLEGQRNKEGSQRNKERWRDKQRGLGMRSHNNQYTAYSYRLTRRAER